MIGVAPVLERPAAASARTGAPRAPSLSVERLAVEFRWALGIVKAVNGVSFDVPAGRTVAVVGKSGSGKTVTSQAILGLLPRSGAITGGRILFDDPEVGGVDLAALTPRAAVSRSIRGRSIAMVFQEPMTAFSPLHTIGDQIGEVVGVHRRAGAAEVRELTIETLRLVRFPEPERALRLYPFELSGSGASAR